MRSLESNRVSDRPSLGQEASQPSSRYVVELYRMTPPDKDAATKSVGGDYVSTIEIYASSPREAAADALSLRRHLSDGCPFYALPFTITPR